MSKPIPHHSLIRPPLLDAWYLTGPTASGKSALSIALAEQLDAEIISVDSMAIYRGMDIGTAKVSIEDRSKTVHHLIDILDPTEDYSLSQFVLDVHRIAGEIRDRGKQVFLVGGTPLYLKSLLRGMFLGPPADWEFRKSVEEDVVLYGAEALRERLMRVDPLSAHKLLPGDVRRMTRALEVARVTGIPLSHWQSQFEKIAPIEPGRAIVLGWDRPILHARVNQRVQEMIDRGLVQEVQGLLARYGQLGRTASQAVGYKETICYLQGLGNISQLTELIQARTRQFVRRQEIWFRGLPELKRISLAGEFCIQDVLHHWPVIKQN